MNYNVLSPSAGITSCFDKQRITHIYYLASPIIEKSNHPLWDEPLFEKFCSYYLTGLSNLLTLCLDHDASYKKSPLSIFIPSTVFLTDPTKGFGEYCAAKAAAETLALNTALSLPSWVFHTPRLPRMQTDQTSGITSTDPMETANIMLNELLKLSS